jgi:hypothetical protein
VSTVDCTDKLYVLIPSWKKEIYHLKLTIRLQRSISKQCCVLPMSLTCSLWCT